MLAKLDGTVMKGMFAADRVKRFYHRAIGQTMNDLPRHREQHLPATADKTAKVAVVFYDDFNTTPAPASSSTFRSLIDGSRILTLGEIDNERTAICGVDERAPLDAIFDTNLKELALDAPRVQPWW